MILATVRHSTLKNSYFENRLFINRIIAAFVVIIALVIVLTVRLCYLQVAGHEHYMTLSKNNRVKISPLPPTRGLIYDRNGEIVAENVATYSLELIPEQVDDLDDTLQRLQSLLQLSDEEIEHFHKIRKRYKSFTSIPLRLRMDQVALARFSVRRLQFPGVEIRARLVRHYPHGALMAHVVGYVGRINESELRTLDTAKYRGTNHIGKVGIEKSYEDLLHGRAGYEEIETNAQGRLINTIGNTPPSPGADLHLTLDIELQQVAADGLGDQNGAVVAIEPGSGNVLVFVSNPGFDPNPFVYGISRKAYSALQSSDRRPLFNRALRGRYPPGSTVKPFVGLAGLEAGATTPFRQTYCPGYYQLPNVRHKYRDWKKWGHGRVNLKAAITQSCDVYFYDLAHNLGINRLSGFMAQFSFGRKTGIDLVGEKSGLLPSREWKQKYRQKPWYPGETLITGIGQGFFQVTPLQLANATAILARRGQSARPHLVKRIDTPEDVMFPEYEPSNVALNSSNIDHVIEAMINVVHGGRGTARRLSKGIDYRIAGKTGTAQVFTVKQEETYNENRVAKKLRDHALFVAFAPADDPRIAISVIVENGGHGGSVAAPIAGTVISRYLSDEQ